MKAELLPAKIVISALLVDGQPTSATLETTSIVHTMHEGVRVAVEPQHVTTKRVLKDHERELLAVLLRKKEEQA